MRRSKIIWNSGHVGRGCFHKFGVASIHGHTGDLLTNAQVLVAFAAKLTLSAGPIDPRHATAVADIDICTARADLNNGADHFMSKDEWLLDNPSQLRPIAIRHVQIGVAYSQTSTLKKTHSPWVWEEEHLQL